LIIPLYKYFTYLLTGEFLVDKYLWKFYENTSKQCGNKILLKGLEYYKDSHMKAYDITKLTIITITHSHGSARVL